MRTVLAASMIIFLSAASAQKAYLTAGIGYGFSYGAIVNDRGMPYTFNSAGATLGKGMTYGFNIGYILDSKQGIVNQKAGIDLGIWYVAGSTYAVDHLDSNSTFVPSRFRGNTLRIMPALKIIWGNRHKFYVKAGALVGIMTEAQYEDEYNVANICATSPYIATYKFSGGNSFGYVIALGINFSGDEKTSLFIEAAGCSEHFKPSKETIDACGSPTVTYQLVDYADPNNPDERTRPTFTFSSIGINAGVKFLLGGKK